MRIDGPGNSLVLGTGNVLMSDVDRDRLTIRYAMIQNHTPIKVPGAAIGMSRQITTLDSANGIFLIRTTKSAF